MNCNEELEIKTDCQDENINKIDTLNGINDKWKERFKAVDLVVIEGKWWKYRPDFWETSITERWKISGKLYGDFGSVAAAFLFGIFYYFFKGMWLKAIVYCVVCSIIEIALLTILPDLSGKTYMMYGAVYASLAPCDYYRLKVLGKQW